MNSGVFFRFLQKRHFSMTSQLRHHYVVSCRLCIDVTFYNFSVTRIVRMIHAKKIMKSCLNLSKLRPKYCRCFFSGHGIVTSVRVACIYTVRNASECHQVSLAKFSQ